MNRRAALVAISSLLSFVGCQSKPAHREIVVGAATSLRRVLPNVASAFEAEHPGHKIVVTYGASGVIAQQVEAGAGVDLVVFAAKAPLDKLASSGRIVGSSMKVVGTNQLVLVGPSRGPKLTFQTLGALPAGEKLAIGDPQTVPVGQYGREALERLGIWNELQGKIVYGANVAAVFAYVQRGEVAAAIVYRTEMEGVSGIDVLDEAKGPWAPRPEIWAGVVVDSQDQSTASQFVEFLTSPMSQRIFREFGFGAP